MTRENADNRELRKFGLLTGAIFALLFGFLLPWLRNKHFPLWPLVLWLSLSVPALLRPQLLRPVNAGWTRFGSMLGWINSRVILAIIFYLLVVPMGFVARMLGHDPMGKTFDPAVDSYRVASRPVPVSNMERPF